jgi:hypothetical protein
VAGSGPVEKAGPEADSRPVVGNRPSPVTVGLDPVADPAADRVADDVMLPSPQKASCTAVSSGDEFAGDELAGDWLAGDGSGGDDDPTSGSSGESSGESTGWGGSEVVTVNQGRSRVRQTAGSGRTGTPQQW